LTTKEEILARAKKASLKNAKKRKDIRFLNVMGFLVAKGFLYTNQQIQKLPNARIDIEDAIWAGKNLEPRILEVLPAAVIRLGKHFNFDPQMHRELNYAIEGLKSNKEGDFFGIPLAKIRPWLNIRLKDRRTKREIEKKIPKTFRLRLDTIGKLKALKNSTRKSEAQIIEDLIDQV
jgi:hypothetical protein